MLKALLLLEGSGLSLLASTTASPAGVPEALSPAQSASEADRLKEAMGGILPLKEWSYSTTLLLYPLPRRSASRLDTVGISAFQFFIWYLVFFRKNEGHSFTISEATNDDEHVR